MNPLRRLTIALFISGSVNIALVSLCCYWFFYEQIPTPFFELKPANQQEQQSPLAIDHSNSEVIRYFKKMPLEWLVTRLKNKQLVENGYNQRDLALASLVEFYHFDLNRALAGFMPPSQKRTITYGKYKDGRPAELIVYPGLSDKYYEAIMSFATRERWPLTSQGLYLILRKGQEPDPSLADAFSMTPEYLAVEMLFGRGEVSVAKNELIEMLLQGDWESLNSFVVQQKTTQDLSAAKRQKFLLDYLQLNSKAAAYVMLKVDGGFARKLDDGNVLKLLELLVDKNSDAEQFAAALLTSPRSDEVWKLAATRLYEYSGEEKPDNLLYRAALTRFVPHHTVIEAAETPAPMIAAAPPILPPPPKPVAPQPAITKPGLATTKPAKSAKPAFKPVVKPVVAAKPVPVASPKKVSEIAYVVQENDTLWKIARRHKMDVNELKAYNKLQSDKVRPGSTLKIPQK